MRIVRPGDRRSLSRSATRALDILEFFGQQRRPLRAVEIARHLDLHPSTANQLLKSMVESAHLAFDAGPKTYLPSPRLARFSGWLVESYGGDERLRQLVRRVQSATGEIVTLTTPNDLFMQVIDMAGEDADAPSGDGVERGLRISIFGSTTGAAYLSTLAKSRLLSLADRGRVDPPAHLVLFNSLADIRRRGFADGASPGGAQWSVAVPLPSGPSSIPFVLGLSGPADRVRTNTVGLGTLMCDLTADFAIDAIQTKTTSVFSGDRDP